MRQHGDQPPTLSRTGAWAINLRSRQGTSNLTHYNGLDMTDGSQACILSDWEGGKGRRGTDEWLEWGLMELGEVSGWGGVR